MTQPPPGFETVASLETFDFESSILQVRMLRATMRLCPLPLAVLSKGQPFELPADLPAGFSASVFEQAWQSGRKQ